MQASPTRALVVLVAILSCQGAFAQESADDPKTLFERGSALYALGRYKEAAPLFERAFELRPDPALLYNAAQAYRLMGDKTRALTLYLNYLRLYGEQIPNRDEVVRQIDELKDAIAADEKAKTSPPIGTQPLGKSDVPPVATTSGETSVTTTPGPATLTAAAPPPRRSLVKRPWFWVAVGGGAAVVVTALAVGIAVGTRGHSTPPASFGTINGN